MKKSNLLFICLILIFCGDILFAYSPAPTLPVLANLDSAQNAELKAMRADVQRALAAVKGKQNPAKMPQLKLYQYKVKPDENFWKVMAATSLDMDTLITLNGLSSPADVKSGAVLYIGNMRGIVLRNKTGKELKRVLREKNIDPAYVEAVNGSIHKEYLFVPCGEITPLERSLFLGTGFTNPLENGRQSSGFGTRKNPFNSKRSQFHTGIDLACPIGSKVMAARDGIVTFVGSKGGYGRLVVLAHEHGYSSLYGHLSKEKVKVGQRVSRGEVIALSGNTGLSTGPHLHFEVKRGNRAVNPGILHKAAGR